jgi:hypothetical protein
MYYYVLSNVLLILFMNHAVFICLIILYALHFLNKTLCFILNKGL